MPTEGIEAIVDVIDRQDWLDRVGKPLQSGINSLRIGRVGTKIMDLLHGVWLKHPLHPVFTDIPVGAWTVGITLDAVESITGDKKMAAGADVATAVGLAGAVGAAVTGLADWQYASGRTRRVGLVHAALNTLSTGLYIGSLIARKNKNRAAGFGLALAGYSTMLLSAYLGGDMVYEQEMGVDHAPEGELPTEYTPVMAEVDLPDEKLTRVYANHTPILLVKRAGRVFALSETCSHLGAPLSEGELTPENTVICPWHQSQFRLEDGGIVNGPTTYPQPCLDVRINNGQIEVAFRKDSR
jgi:nitrite reductase/ring-hydroxylating ferredoxin subunit/uncharacterized membrane protein